MRRKKSEINRRVRCRESPLRERPARTEVISSSSCTRVRVKVTALCAPCSAEEKLKVSGKPRAAEWEFSAAGRKRRQTGAPFAGKVPLRERPVRTELFSSSDSTQATANHAPPKRSSMRRTGSDTNRRPLLRESLAAGAPFSKESAGAKCFPTRCTLFPGIHCRVPHGAHVTERAAPANPQRIFRLSSCFPSVQSARRRSRCGRQ